jgi:uncharacterized protein YeeX (DUF496 family)
MKITTSELKKIIINEVKQLLLKESTQDYTDEANVLVTKIANNVKGVNSDKLYEYIINNTEVIKNIADELSKIESKIPSNEFTEILMSFPKEVIKLSKNL